MTGTGSGSTFHLSLRVADLAVSRRFYEGVLGCVTSRDEGAWVDVDFFGHQLTLHQQTDHPRREAGASSSTLDHFGPVLDKAAWISLGERLAANGIAFQLAPLVTGEGSPAERGKFVIVDPDGVGLEFKYRA